MRKTGKKIRNGFGLTLMIIGTVCIISFLTEGYVYYYKNGIFVKWFDAFFASFVNAIQCFFANSDVGLKEISDQFSSNNGSDACIGRIYLFCKFVAPLVTVSSTVELYENIKKYFNKLFRFLSRRTLDKIFIFGSASSKQVRDLAESSSDKYDVYIVDSESIDYKKEIEMLREGISFIKYDPSQDEYSLSKRNAKQSENSHESSINKQKTELEKILNIATKKGENINIVLLNSKPIQNIYLLDTVSDMIYRQNNAHKLEVGKYKIFINCDNVSAKKLLTSHIDSYYKWKDGKKNEYNLIKPFIFDLNHLRIKEMFECENNERTRLHYFNVNNNIQKLPYEYSSHIDNPWNVHIVIAGFGELGRAAANYVLNNGVLHSRSSITLEVFDHNMDKNKGIFMRNIADYKVLNEDETSIKIGEDENRVDGIAQINFYNADLRTDEFKKQLDSIQKKEQITYFAVCIDDEDLCLDTIETIRSYILHNYDPVFEFVPIVAFLSTDKNTAINIFEIKNDDKDSIIIRLNLQLISKDYLRLRFDEHLLKNEDNVMAKKFHFVYSMFLEKKVDWDYNSVITNKKDYNDFKKEINRNWYEDSEVSRQSSLAQSQHQIVNRMLLDFYEKKTDITLDDLFKQIKSLVNYEKIKGGELEKVFDAKEFVRKINNDIDLKTKILKEFAMLEHRRWELFHLANGYIYDGKKDKKRYIHNCLVNWELLSKGKNKHTCIYDLYPLITIFNQNEIDKAIQTNSLKNRQ